MAEKVLEKILVDSKNMPYLRSLVKTHRDAGENIEEAANFAIDYSMRRMRALGKYNESDKGAVARQAATERKAAAPPKEKKAKADKKAKATKADKKVDKKTSKANGAAKPKTGKPNVTPGAGLRATAKAKPAVLKVATKAAPKSALKTATKALPKKLGRPPKATTTLKETANKKAAGEKAVAKKAVKKVKTAPPPVVEEELVEEEVEVYDEAAAEADADAGTETVEEGEVEEDAPSEEAEA